MTDRPTRFGAAIVAAVTALSLVGLVSIIGQADRVVLGVAAGVLLAGTLWALERDRYRWLAVAGGTVAVPAVGSLLLVGVGGAVVAQFRTNEPVGTALVVLCACVAALGVGVTLAGGFDRSTLSGAVGVAVPAIGVPGVLLAVLVLTRFLPVGREVGAVLGGVLGVILDPAPYRVHLGVWLGLVVGAVAAVRAAVRALPVSELRTSEWENPLSGLSRYAPVAGAAAAFVALVAVTAELLGRPYAGLPQGVEALLVAVTGSSLLRLVLVGTTLVAVAIVLVTASVRRGYRASGGRLFATVTPFLVAFGLAWWLLAAGDAVATAVRSELARRVPAPATEPALEQFDTIVEFYGADLFALTVLVGVTIAGALVVIGLYVAVATGRVPARAGGPAMAAAGLFATAGIGVVQGAPLLVGLLGAVASVVVWDGGAYGLRVVAELDDGVESLRPELVHVGATLSVGVVAGAFALSLSAVLSGTTVESAVIPALLGAVVGALFLVVASR